MKTLNELYTTIQEGEVEEKMNPAKAMQLRRAMGRRMKLLAKKSSTKMKKKRSRLRRRSSDQLTKSAARQAKMMVIKRSLGKNVKYNELPLQKRIQIDQKIVARKAAVIQKISKKLLRGLKAGESERIRRNKLAQADAVGD
tara:strand:+ start:159 stop:581 length:423 start_codon:yes stop_codon:yes gene_type:complete